VASARPAGWSKSTRTRSSATAFSRAPRPANAPTNSWLFPPPPREAPFGEKWAFVAKKEKHGDPNDPADARCGDPWDHVAFAPEHRLVVSVVPGKRTAERVHELVQDFQRRTGGRRMSLLTSDEYPADEAALLAAYGVVQEFPRTGRPGRPKQPITVPHPARTYATVHQTRANGRVVKVEPRVVFGTVVAVRAALAVSLVSKAVNTFFIERHHGTDRHHKGRKVRKSYGFSKDGGVHEAMTYCTRYSYHFCWPVRPLRVRGSEGHGQQRTPAMAAGLTDHVGSLQEGVTRPAVQH
jgi:hypothetical protein